MTEHAHACVELRQFGISDVVFQLPDDLTLLSLQPVLGDVGSEVVFTHDPDWDSAD